MANRTRVWVSARGQYLTTVPRALGEALGLAGAILVWEVVGRDTLRVRVRRPERLAQGPADKAEAEGFRLVGEEREA